MITLHNIGQYTLVEVISFVIKKMEEQGCLCLRAAKPKYKNKDECCAIGVLIPEKSYDPQMEDLNIISLLNNRDFNFDPVYENVLDLIQDAHDHSIYYEEMMRKLYFIQYKLIDHIATIGHSRADIGISDRINIRSELKYQ